MSLYVTRGRDEAATEKPTRRRPRLARVLVLVLLVAVIGALLLVEAYVNASFTPDGAAERPAGSGSVPADLRQGGPVIDALDERLHTFRPESRTIALTFDDGPDPRWTPQILRVLAEYRVPATFFVIGSQVTRYPDLTNQIVAAGHEIGVHSFSHPRLESMPQWRRQLEYSQTQMAIAYATGVKTSIQRPPYSSTADAVRDPEWPQLRQTGRQGYLTVLEDTDSQDWARPGVDKIMANATPDGDRGAVVLMHDAGGDRAQTVAALRRYLPEMLQRGYRFATLSQAVPAVGAVNSPAPRADRWRGAALVWTVQAADGLMKVLWVLLLVVGALTLMRTLLLFAVAVRHARRRRGPDWRWGPPVTQPVSVIVPAFNERETIAATVRTLAASDHPDVEIIVVDDESDDATVAVVQELGLPNVRVARIPSGGKPAALNAGIALASHDLIVMIDADTVVASDALWQLVQPFADERVGAVAGNVKVGNRRGVIAAWQHIEYVIGFNLDRRLYDALGCMPTVPGALGAFRRQALTDVGGLSTDTLAEDTDLTMAILRAGWRVVYQETAVSRTEAPTTLSALWRQRYRWSYGTIQSMWKHRRSVVESGASGRFGRRGLPLIALFTVVLPLFGPLLDLLTVYGTVFLDRWITLVGWLAVLVLQIITAVLAFKLDREPLRALWALPLQQFVYRQLMYLVLAHAAMAALTGRRLRWHKLSRTGEVAADAASG